MSNKKYSDFSTGTGATGTKILLIADPTTGALEKITLASLATFFGSGSVDTTAPTIVSITASAATTVAVVFSESVTVTTSGWSFLKNGSAWTASSVSGSGTSWSFTMATSAASTDTLTYSYAQSTGNTIDASSNELANISGASITNSISSGYDTDASAYFNAAGITDTTQKNAVNQLVLDMKSASIWTKMQAIYPFVGGTATTHKWNLKNPSDTDAAFRIAFSGTITHNANGITGDGSTGWGNTFLSASNTTATSIHLAIYSKTSTVSNGYAMGSGGISGGTPTVVIEPRYTSDVIYACTNNYFSDANDYSYANTNGTGFYITSRTASNAWFIQKGATESSVFTNATVSPYFPDTINLLRMGGAANAYSNRNLAFASVGTGLTTAEADLLNTAVTAFQTTLSRA